MLLIIVALLCAVGVLADDNPGDLHMIFVKNDHSSTVEIYFADKDTDELTATLEPGAGVSLSTYAGHEFWARDAEGKFQVAVLHVTDDHPEQWRVSFDGDAAAARKTGTGMIYRRPRQVINEFVTSEGQRLTTRLPLDNWMIQKLQEKHESRDVHDVWLRRFYNEVGRDQYNREQPKAVQWFTKKGYKLIKGGFPDKQLWADLLAFRDQQEPYAQKEGWPLDNTYVNHWEVPTYMMHLTPELKKRIFDALVPILEEWTGEKNLEPTACYGIRRYERGAVLQNHVDRVDTHALSVITNLDQRGLDADWPLEIYDHEGNVDHVIISPGDIVLYESASIIHGRPEALKGDAFFNFFTHTRPNNWLETMKSWQRPPAGSFDAADHDPTRQH